MKLNVLLILLLPGLLILDSCNSQQEPGLFNNEPRQEILLNFGWRFFRGDTAGAQLPGFDDKNWRILQLPHDWSIEDLPGKNSPIDENSPGGISTGYYTGGTGWYRKDFFVPQELRGKIIQVLFEGIYMNADVWINGVHLGNHPYGYTSFYRDLTRHIRYGSENVLAVQVKNEGRNSRWYSGSGIYRNVWLSVMNPVYFKTWGTAITTFEVTGKTATVVVTSEIINQNQLPGLLQFTGRIFDPDGKEVAVVEDTVTVTGSDTLQDINVLKVKAPLLWSINAPNLYKLVAELKDEEGNIVDNIEETFGIRTIDFSVGNGFRLNGQSLLLKGGCVHHDNGPLGAAAFDRAEERRVELLKASGFNAIRCAHNPPSVAFLNACDKLGMLVIDEAFDMWRRPKNPQDYHLYFDEHWKEDIKSMVHRDRNHPSIIMWSTGNEIPERGEPEGVETSGMLAGYVRQLDPTRPVTAAVNGLNPGKDPYFATLGVSGYNYSYGGDHGQKSIFKTDHERVPGRIMYCAESYPLEAYGAWMDVIDHSYVLGDFVWTAFDYLGEASIGWRGYPHDESFYPWNHAFCGDIDICGFKRPQSYYRDVLWEVGNRLSVFVRPPVPSFPEKPNRASWSKWHWHDHVADWNWEGYENQPIEVIVYSGHPEVELLLNGTSLGIKQTNKDNMFMAMWNVPWQSGELKAVARNGKKAITEAILRTAGSPAGIKLAADRNRISANGTDLCFISFVLHDENNLRNPKAENLVHFDVSGPGKIIAVANPNPMSTESFQQSFRKAWQGRGLVVVRAGVEKGKITLTASSGELKPAETVIVSE